ncbi:MAG: hypothetical protein AUH39_02200 [Chloroflexi bacterium 13_1_40CM_67_9]|nr:MAG: hypothetical protein AUH39_02200 [Chloroflexi bacterium 13_1_40CM_67_9]
MTVLRGILTTWPGRLFAIALVALIAGGAVVASRVSAQPGKPEIRTQAVTRGSVIQSVAVSGSVAAMNQTKMSFKASGKIAAIYVSVGQQVTAGQPLAKLDTTDLEAALAQAQANLVTAQNNYSRTASTTSDAQKALNQARQQAAQDLATAQAALAKLTTNYVAAKSNFSSFSDNATSGIASFQDSLATIQSQIDGLIAEMQRIVGGGDTGDLRNALNAISGANSPALQNARANSVTLLSPALADYQSARAALLSLVAQYDAAAAAGSDTTGIASSFQLTQTNYTIATSRLTGALDTTSAVLATVQGSVTTAQASLNTQSTKGLHDPFDQAEDRTGRDVREHDERRHRRFDRDGDTERDDHLAARTAVDRCGADVAQLEALRPCQLPGERRQRLSRGRHRAGEPRERRGHRPNGGRGGLDRVSGR